MIDSIWGVVFWHSRTQMLKDVNTVYYRCRGCAAGKRLPRNPARLRRTKGKRPFLRLQVDLYEVTPPAEDGTNMIMTTHCTWSRYPFFRKQKGKTAIATATNLFDVILDCGVVPEVIQTDLGKEFTNSLVAELLGLLGSSQVFSSAVHPQSQGITERPHRDMTALLAMLVERLVQTRPDTWPEHLRTLECRCRDKTIGKSGFTPRSLVAGWFGVTPLQSALAMIGEIPSDLPYDEWVRNLVADHQELATAWDEWRAEAEAKEDEYYNERMVCGRQIEVGELVLLQKAETERRAGGKLLEKADGPYEVVKKPSPHTAMLAEPYSKEVVLEGRPMPVARLIRWAFPKELPKPTAAELESGDADYARRMTRAEILLLQPNDLVCAAVEDKDADGDDCATVVMVDAVHMEQERVSGRRMEPQGTGPWAQRLWALARNADGSDGVTQVPFKDLLAQVELEAGHLTGASAEMLKKVGVIL